MLQQFNEYRQQFMEYLQIERNASMHTLKNYLRDLHSFYTFICNEGVNEFGQINEQLIRIYLTNLHRDNYSRRTISRKLASLRSFYKFMIREEFVKYNPFLHVHTPKPVHEIPSFFYAEEMEKLFTISDLNSPLGQRNQAILELLYATGIRVSECVGIYLEDIDFDLGIVLVTGKGRKDRYLPFGSYAENALTKYIENGRSYLLGKAKVNNNALFLNAKGNPLSERGVRLILNKLVEKSALTVDIHPHKLRHTFATHMLNEGADLRVVQELLGHEHLSSTQIYTHVTKDHLRNIYRNSHPRATNGNN
ncbi:tyrosine recombinase XerC [Aquibacillus koreensis]|uniref:Tyrosine recombinase XerC n=1 Tax=Aquibacillus koreensis TaxID=279446 RepID=A0A9X3WR97_9BACI|nr:tyrosine recombinase XerC [Aquibacillus koreensis]MCT2534512.1 tyrosine recombinase XerC [Aquibacillus koreensis]MDC3421894.1 tyrosine recombinase XerC [Aquibacillus koreensis]